MKKHKFTLIYGLVLASFTLYMGLDTFVLASVYSTDTDEMNASLFNSEEVATLDSTEATVTMNDTDSTSSSETSETTDSSTDEASASDSSGSTDSSSNSSSSGKKHGGHGKRSSSSSSSDTSGSSDSGSTDSESSDSESSDSTSSSSVTSSSAEATIAGIIGTYDSDDAQITVTEYTYEDTEVYVADVTLSSVEYLKTAFAQGSYGKNVTETTSSMASDNNAILAINGDNYGSQESGYVIRNGVIYRDEAGENDVLCIYADGSMEVVDPEEYTAEELVEKGVWQAFSFGPGLVEDGEVTVSETEEVGKAMASNPRTAIGMIDSLHYVIVVSDGRTDESEGLTLYQLAQFMDSLGVTCAYNLDGGGSSTMVFNGSVINNPTTNGDTIKERS
nr:phosphodiester glycosidase family protein [Lachnospiraceae bacterium]